MNNISKLIIVLVLVIGILGFRAYKSYTDANILVANQLIFINKINEQQMMITTLAEFSRTEFPSQVKDFTDKAIPKK